MRAGVNDAITNAGNKNIVYFITFSLLNTPDPFPVFIFLLSLNTNVV